MKKLTYHQAKLLNRILEQDYVARVNLTRTEKAVAQSLLKRGLIREIRSNNDDVHLYFAK